ncbi:MAG: 6-bladed beta-propeller [Bacteroidales bacterium]|nr:6-bladed beta-propeller [Bacteroidales bacterium]
MTYKKSFILFSICIVLFNCSSRERSIPVIDLQKPGSVKEIFLSEMITDIYMVRLETSDEVLLGQYTNYLVSEKYIITIDNEKILQFTGKGKFIRTLAKVGRGPDEFMRVDAFALDKINDILYINHRGDSKHIVVFNLSKDESIKRIPTGVDNIISQMIVLNDSVLIMVPRMNKEYNLYYLSTSGRILDGIAPPKVKGIGLQTSIERVLNNVYYMPKEYDTMYTVIRTGIEPYCFFNVEDRFSFENNEVGNFVYISVNAPGFLLANKAHARIEINDDGETYSMNADKLTRYWINKKDHSVSEIKGFYNDYFGIREEIDPWSNYVFVNNDLAFITYPSFDLKKMIKATLESKNLDEVVRHRISILNEQTGENDNPVLVIGKLRN